MKIFVITNAYSAKWLDVYIQISSNLWLRHVVNTGFERNCGEIINIERFQNDIRFYMSDAYQIIILEKR